MESTSRLADITWETKSLLVLAQSRLNWSWLESLETFLVFFYSSFPIILLGHHSLPFQEGSNKIAITLGFSAREMSLKAIWTCHPQERVDIDLPWTTTGI